MDKMTIASSKTERLPHSTARGEYHIRHPPLNMTGNLSMLRSIIGRTEIDQKAELDLA